MSVCVYIYKETKICEKTEVDDTNRQTMYSCNFTSGAKAW